MFLNQSMILKITNTIKSVTLYIVQNVKIRVTGLKIRLQIHVITTTLFEVLLKRPFFAIIECKTKNYVNEDQVIILTDLEDKSR